MAHGYSTLEVIRLKSDSVMANCDETRGVEAEAEAEAEAVEAVLFLWKRKREKSTASAST